MFEPAHLWKLQDTKISILFCQLLPKLANYMTFWHKGTKTNKKLAFEKMNCIIIMNFIKLIPDDKINFVIAVHVSN